jgi:hypothetical protein
MTKITETQAVILFRAINKHKGIVPTLELSGCSCDARGYGSAIAALIKRELVEQDGMATETAYNKGGYKLRVTAAGEAALEENDDEDVAAALEDQQSEMDEEEADEDEGDDDEAQRTVVKNKYKVEYKARKAEGGSGQDCNDEFAKWTNATFKIGEGKKSVLSLALLIEWAEENGIDMSRYAHLNNGQKKMNSVNVARGMLRKGVDILWRGKVVFKGRKQEA